MLHPCTSWNPRFHRRTLSPLTYNALTSLSALRQWTFFGRNARCLSLLRYMGIPSWLRTPGCRARTFSGSSLLFVNISRSFESYHLLDL